MSIGNNRIVLVARNTFRLLRRGHILNGMTLLSALAGGVVFWFTGAGDTFADALPMKIRYGVLAATAVLGAITVYTAAQTTAADLTGREFHAMTSAPVSRVHLWLGRLLGFWVATVCAFTITLAVFGILGAFSATEDTDALSNIFAPPSVEIDPDLPDFNAAAEKEYAQLEERERVADETERGKIIFSLRQKIRSAYEHVGTDNMNAWIYPLESYDGTQPLQILFSCTGAERYRLDTGMVVVNTLNGGRLWEGTLSFYPYVQTKTLEIPATRIPAGTDAIEVQFYGINNQPLMFEESNHIRLAYIKGTWANNIIIFYGLHLLWLLGITALALGLVAGLSFHTAVFASLLLFFTAFCTPYFQGVADEWARALNNTAFDNLQIDAIRLIANLISAFAPPPITTEFSEGSAIQPKNYATWLMYFSILFGFFLIVGGLAIRRRELSREGEGS